MKKEVILVFSLLLLLCAASVSAKSMKLLAVSKIDGGFVGTSADLELEIEEGTGRVFISTFPLTGVDTQISFRMAKEYACDFLDRDCSRYDFYFVVSSDSPIVGGPSAGGAATMLAIAALDNLNLDQEVAATGTINSGGIIGPVAGIKYKIDAAEELGMRKALIPAGTRYYDKSNEEIAASINETLGQTAAEVLSNSTIDLVEYGRSKGIEVIEVEDIHQAIYQLTGKSYPRLTESVVIDPKYQAIMKNISDNLCGRSLQLMGRLDAATKESHSDVLDTIQNLTESGRRASGQGLYYASASYCYGANVKLDYLTMLQKNFTRAEIEEKISLLENESRAIGARLDTFEYSTINDMQTFLVVKERLSECQQYLNDSRYYLNLSKPDALYSLALASERLYSTYYWSGFFGQGGKSFNIDEHALAGFCLDKISEADERIQYIKSFYLLPMDSLNAELDSAMADYSSGSYELCVFKATKVKARANLILNAIGLRDEDFARLLSRKIEIARETIVKETKRDIFPLLGYSYYEYSRSLEQEDPSASLLYAELSLELSSFDMYFDQERKSAPFSIDPEFIIIFLGGALAGFVISSVVTFFYMRKAFSARVEYTPKRGKRVSRR